MIDHPQNPTVIIITGMHRSGTSLTASLLQNAGINLGDRLMAATEANAKGYFEDWDFVEFHQDVLGSQGIERAGWTKEKAIAVQQQYWTTAHDLIAARQDLPLWGWKDPRTCLFLDFWSQLIPTAKYIFVYRSPWEVVDSLFRRGDEVFRHNPNFAVDLWCTYNQAILDFRQRYAENTLLLEITHIIKDHNKAIASINQKLGLDLAIPESVYEPDLFTSHQDNYRQGLITQYFPQAIELYQQLKEQGDLQFIGDRQPLAVEQICQSWILQDWSDRARLSLEKRHIEKHLGTHVEQMQQQLDSNNAEVAKIQELLIAKDTQLIQTQQQLQATQGELAQTQQQLQIIHAELAQTQQQLAATKAEQTQTQQRLEASNAELIKTQERLQATSPELIKTQQQLQHIEHKYREAEKLAQIAQMQADQYKILIVAMETSKFWRLRTWWLNFKQKNGLKGTDILYQNYLLSNNAVPIVENIISVPTQTAHPTADTPQYSLWLHQKYPNANNLRRIKVTCRSLAYKPLISVIMPVYNPGAEFLRQAIESVTNQVYDNWELCIADDCSTKSYVRKILDEYAQKDQRIKVVYRPENGHICRSSNSAIEVAEGEYIALLDHDDLLAPHALARVTEFLNQHPEADFIYSDEDKVDHNNVHRDHFFKPDWCPDSFLSRMYTCHLGVYRRSLVNEIGNFRVGFEGSQDYDLVLRLTEKTDKIFHIPDILYHWRIHLESTAGGSEAKPYATNAAHKALAEALVRRGEPGEVISRPNYPGIYRIRYQIKEPKKVSIIIPTKDLADVLDVCLQSIFAQTTYPNYEVVIIDNGSTEAKTQKCFARWSELQSDRFKYYPYDVPFNYSQINNYGVSKAEGDYLLFLNNDTKVITDGWLQAMVEQAQRPSIGAVGAMLLYPDDTIQHAGVVLGLGGVAGHSHKHFHITNPGYISQLVAVNNYSAVTGACLMCRREVFAEVGGFEENLAIAFNDVDLCIRMIERGYRNIHLPHVLLYHYESKSRGYEDTPSKQARFTQEVNYMRQKWHLICDRDPCYNPNLTRCREDYSLNV